MVHRGGSRVLLFVILLGIAVAVLVSAMAYGPAVEWWYLLHLRRAEPEKQWELASAYEERGPAARSAAEDWYLEVLRSWTPDKVTTSQRNPMAIQVRVPSPETSQSSLGSFHYPDEADAAMAAVRLGELRSLEAIPLLVAHLERSNPDPPVSALARSVVRQSLFRHHTTGLALFALRPESIEALVELSASEKPNARLQAVLTLSHIVEAGVADRRSQDAILAGYCDSDPALRGLGRDLLRNLASSKDDVPDLLLATVLDCLRRDPTLAGDPAHDFVVLARDGGAAGEALRAALQDPTLPVESRKALIASLAGWVPAERVEPVLRDLLREQSREIRVVALRAIRNLVCRSPKTIEALGDALSGDADPLVRQAAVLGLKELGKRAKLARSAIWTAALEDPDAGVRRLARGVLEGLDSE